MASKINNKNVTRELAEFVVRTTYADLPENVVKAAKRMILDIVGCGIAGTFYAKKEVLPVLKVSEEVGGKGECTIIVDGKKTSWFNAILINGTFMHSIDFDDTRPGPITHTGALVVPPSLALNEKLGGSGKDAILSVVLAYEVVSRIGSSVMPSHYHYWHSTGTNGTFGGAVIAGKLLGLNVDQMDMTLGIAADQASGLITCLEFGDLTKSLHAGLTSAKGVLAAMLVKHGATGPRGILEFSQGYCNAYSKEPKTEKIIDGLGNSFDIINNCPKSYPAILGSHCIIDAVLKIIKANKIEAADVKQVTVKTFTIAVDKCSNRLPGTPLAARMSIPYCIAATILDRELGMEQFKEDRLQDQRIQALIAKIDLAADPELDRYYPEMYPATVTIITINDQVFHAKENYPKGFPQNPMSDAELESKFESLSGTVFGSERIKEIKDMISQMESLKNISELIRRLVK